METSVKFQCFVTFNKNSYRWFNVVVRVLDTNLMYMYSEVGPVLNIGWLGEQGGLSDIWYDLVFIIFLVVIINNNFIASVSRQHNVIYIQLQGQGTCTGVLKLKYGHITSPVNQ